jgi:hypothetical protein
LIKLLLKRLQSLAQTRKSGISVSTDEWSEPKFQSDLAGLVQRDDGSQPENDRGAHALQIPNRPLGDRQPFCSEIVVEPFALNAATSDIVG